MLPPKTPVQPLPSISSLLSDSPSACNPTEESYYGYDQCYNSPLINIAYQPQTIYINQWQGFPPNPYMHSQYSLSPSYPMMGMPDLNTSSTDNSHNFSLGDVDKILADAENDLKINTSNFQFGKKKRNSKHARPNGICSHCSTSTTTLWRKNESGALECNACNLYYRRNKIQRPLNLVKEKPATRNRRKVKKEILPIPLPTFH